MAKRNAHQPIAYSASYDPEPMTPEAFARVQRYLARLLAQTLVACPDLLGIEETEAGLLVPATMGMEIPGDLILPDDLQPEAMPLAVMAHGFSEVDLLLAYNTAARQGSGFRSAWVRWLKSQVTAEKGFRVFSLPTHSPDKEPDYNNMIYRATHLGDRHYYRPRGEWRRQCVQHSESTFATLRRTA